MSKRDTVIFSCGNILPGHDKFVSAVVMALNREKILFLVFADPGTGHQ